MSLTQIQKNIINPFPEDTLGEAYDFMSARNRLVLDAIHEAYISNAVYPEDNQVLKITVEELQSLVGATIAISQDDLLITHLDMRAYLSLYPQNGILVDGKIQSNSLASSRSKLEDLAIDLQTRGVYKLYSTDSNPLSLLEENQAGNKKLTSRLISISPSHSPEYVSLIRKAIGLQGVPAITDSEDNSSIYGLITSDNTVNTFLSNDTGIDLYDWRKNCIPDTDNDKVYYNPVDDNYYYTRRTSITDINAFDISSFISPSEEDRTAEQIEEIAVSTLNSLSSLQRGGTFDYSLAAINAAETGISEILKFSGKYSEENASTVYGARADFQNILDQGIENIPRSLEQVLEILQTITDINPYTNDNFVFSTYLRPRPGSRWMYVVKVPKKTIDLLGAGSGVVLSYEEFELTSLQRAKALVNPEKNKSENSKTFTVDQIQRYIPFVSLRARNYSYQLEDDNVTPNLIGGIDLASEVSKLNSFMDLLSLCFSYNKVSIKDDDMFEMFFTEDYQLDHLCINGVAFTRGIGNVNYHQIPAVDEEQPQRILDAFSLLSPTTFSLIYNSFEIYQETQIASEDNYAPWMDWMKAYVYPTLNLLPTEIEKINDRSREDIRAERKKDVFIRVSRLANSGKSAEEIKLLYANRKLDYKIGNTINNINCNTGQARAVKSALQFWQAITGKTKFRSILRQTILTLRDEVISDEVSRELLKSGIDVQSLGRQGLAVSNNPAQFRRQIEREINEQIFCGLDVLGGFIETSFLDPKDMNPQKKTKRAPKIGAQPKVKMPAPPPISPYYAKAKLYEKMMEEAILGFLRALIAGVLKDIIEATLGCGPNQNEELNDSMKNLAFGFVNVNSFLEGVDIVGVAKSAGLYNITYRESGNIKEDPTHSQVFSLLSDISLMCTPVELQSMLLGDGTHLLYTLIVETISNGQISFPTSQYTNVDGNNEKFMSTIDPSVYNKFQFTVENVRELFILLGEAMDNRELDEISELAFSPFAAYCDSKDANLAPLTLRLSVEQLEAQFSLQSQDKIRKINALCDWLRSLENIKQQLIEFINSLGIMEFYDKLLQLIADISNYIADSLADLWDSLFSQDVTNTQDPEFTMYMTQMGRDLFYQIYSTMSTSYPAAMSPNLEIYNLKFSPTRINEIVYTVPQSWSGDSGKTNTREIARYFKPTVLEEYLIGPGMLSTTEERLEEVARRADAAALIIGGYNTRTRTVGDDKIRSNLALPFSPPRTEPWLFGWVGGSSTDYPLIEHRIGSYALRTAPANLRNRLTRMNPDGTSETDQENYYLRLGQFTESWISGSVSANLSKPVPIHLSVRGVNEGGVRIYRAPQSKGITPKMTDENTIAQYIPSPSDYEPDQDNITYYGLLSGIDNDARRTLRLGLFADDPVLPSRISISDIISNTLRGYIESTIPGQTNWQMNGSFNRLYAAKVNPAKYNSTENKDFINNNEEKWRSTSQILSEDFINAISISNPLEFIDRNINQGYIHDKGRRNLPKYMSSFNRPVFTIDPDPCITVEESYIAQASIGVLQARMQGMFLNTLSLARTYPHWGSFGTKALVADYLTRKVIPELESRQLLNLIYENFDIIKKVYGNLSSNSLDIDDAISPRDNLKSIISAMFQKFLDNSSENVGNSIDKSLYIDSVTNRRYRRMLSRFFHKMSINIKRGAGSEEAPYIQDRITQLGGSQYLNQYNTSRSFGITNAEDRQRVTNFIENDLMLRDEEGNVLENVTDLGLLYGAYYFPAPFLIATYLIYYDSEINLSNRFSQAYYRTEVEIAIADDNLISALTGQQVFKFQQAFTSFPQDEVTWNGLQVTYFSADQVESRISVLDSILLTDREELNNWLSLQASVTPQQASALPLRVPGYRADLIVPELIPGRSGNYPRDFIRATLDGSLPSLIDVFGSTTSLWLASADTFSNTVNSVAAYREWFQQATQSEEYDLVDDAGRDDDIPIAYEFTAATGDLNFKISVPFSFIGEANSNWNDMIARVFFLFAGYRYQLTQQAAFDSNPDSAEIFDEIYTELARWLINLVNKPDQDIDSRNLAEVPTERRAVGAFVLIRSERSRLGRLLKT